MPFLLLDRDKEYSDQQDFNSHVQALLNPPVPADQAERTVPVAPPEPGAGTAGPPSPSSSFPAPLAPVTAPLVAPPSTQQPVTGQQFSPYDAIFAKYAGALANDPMFMSIVAAGTKAESGWDAGNRTGDGGHSWGLFQMHDAGAGAGMGNARLDPDAASAAMVPRYAAAYQVALARGLTGAALAAATAQGAERSADASGSAYARAWNEIMGGGGQTTPGGLPTTSAAPASVTGMQAPVAEAPAPSLSALDQFGDHVRAITNGAVDLGGQAVGAVKDDVSAFNDHVKAITGGLVDLSGNGQPAGMAAMPSSAPEATVPAVTPGGLPSAISGMPDVSPPPPPPPSLPGPLDIVKQKFSDALDAFGGLLSNVGGPSPTRAQMQAEIAAAPPLNIAPDPLSFAGSGLGAPTGGEQMTAQRNQAIAENNPLRDVPFAGGASTMAAQMATDPTNLMLAGAGGTRALANPVVRDALGAFARSRLPAEADANFAAGGLPGLLGRLAQYPEETRQGLEDFVATQSKAGQTPEAIGDTVVKWMQDNPPPVFQAPTTATGGAPPAPPIEPPPVATAAPPPSGPRQIAPVTKDQVAPQGPLANVVSAVNSAFQPMENLPPGEVKDALQHYAAAVGQQSQGARVVADTAGHNIAEGIPQFSQAGLPVESAGAAQSAAEAQARADLNGVLQSNGLSESTPEIAAILRNITSRSAIAANPLGAAALGANTAIKGSLFGLSNLHNYTEAVNAVVSGGLEAAANYVRAFVSPSFYDGVRYGTLAPDFNRAAMAGVTGLLRGGGGSDVYQIANIATRAVIGAVGGAGAGYEESLRAGDTQNALRNAGIGALAGAGAGVAAPALFSSLFGRAVPLAKVTVFKQLTDGGMPELQAASAVNRTFGGLNYAQMGRSQTLQDAMRFLMTAPDWNESTVRQLGSAVTGGKGGDYSRGLLAKAIAGSMIGSEILSYALNGKSTFENEPGHQLEVQVGTDKNNRGVYMGFMPGNIQAYGNLIDKLATVPDSGKYVNKANTLTHFATGRAGLPFQVAANLAGKEYILGPDSKNTLASVASTAAPIGVGSAAQGLERGAGWGTVIASLLAGPNLSYGSKAGQATRSPIPGFQAPTTKTPAKSGQYHP